MIGRAKERAELEAIATQSCTTIDRRGENGSVEQGERVHPRVLNHVGLAVPRAGFFHVYLTDPDPAGLAQRIAAAGGRQRGRVWSGAGGDHYRFVNTEDRGAI